MMSGKPALTRSAYTSPTPVGPRSSRRNNVRIAIAILLLSSFPLSFGQQPTPKSASSSKQAPLELHREQSGSNVHPGSIGTPSILQQYDFGAQVRTLTEG